MQEKKRSREKKKKKNKGIKISKFRKVIVTYTYHQIIIVRWIEEMFSYFQSN